MLTAILFALMGIGLGQLIKVEIDPRLLSFLDGSITAVRSTTIPAAKIAAKSIKSSATKQVKRLTSKQPGENETN